MSESKKGKAAAKKPTKAELAKKYEERALAKGKKPFTTVKEWACMTPEDADELLAAIKEMREADRRAETEADEA